jgi:hypothetical protein
VAAFLFQLTLINYQTSMIMNDVFHKIKVNLYENFLTENPNDYSAKVISERTLNVKEICQTAVRRGGAPSTAEAMEHNVALFLKEMAWQLMDGYAVNTGYFTANAQVRGVFDSRSETFDPAKHAVLFRFNQGDILRKEIPNVKVQVMGVGESGIVISHVVDTKTGSVNDLITPGGTLKIKGGKLRIAGENPQVGVSFEDEAGNTVRVEERDVVVNNPSELILQIPVLTAGRYQLTICTQFGGNSKQFLKEPRTAVFEKILTVE